MPCGEVMRATPGTASVVSRAVVSSTSGAMVILPILGCASINVRQTPTWMSHHGYALLRFVPLVLFELYDLDTTIGATGHTDVVWSRWRAALWTGHQLWGLHSPVAPAVSSTAFRYLSFGQCPHSFLVLLPG